VRQRERSTHSLSQLTHTPLTTKLGEAVSRLSRFAGLLHAVLAQPCEPRLADAAAHCLGALVRAGGALTADVVEREVRCLNKTSKPESFLRVSE
jgi:predicted ATPase